MTFGIQRTVTPGVSYRWLGSAHATDAANSVTIDKASLTPQTHYPDGWIDSGFAIGADGAGKYEPFDAMKHDKVAFVLEPVRVRGGDIVAAAIWHGEINNDELPFPLTSAGITVAENGQFTINEEGGS